MKSVYERPILTITEFDTEYMITTSGAYPDDPADSDRPENAYGDFGDFESQGPWF